MQDKHIKVPGLVFPNIFSFSLMGPPAAAIDELSRLLPLTGLSSMTKFASSASF